MPDYSLPTGLEGLVSQMCAKGMNAGDVFEAQQRQIRAAYTPCIPLFWSGFTVDQDILMDKLALIMLFNEIMTTFRESLASHLRAKGETTLADSCGVVACREKAFRRILHCGITEFHYNAERHFVAYEPPADDASDEVKANYKSHCAGADVRKDMSDKHQVELAMALVNMELLKMRRVVLGDILGLESEAINELVAKQFVADASPREVRRGSDGGAASKMALAAASTGRARARSDAAVASFADVVAAVD